MGRSRGGLTTKIHAVVDRNGLPVRLALTPGQDHDNALAADLLADLKPQSMVLADRAYDADAIRRIVNEQDAREHPAQAQPQGPDLLQSVPLQGPKSHRTLLQQNEALQTRRNPV